jgi:DNA end-binding protein Ku
MAGLRAIWKGSIKFGIVTIPVKLYAATQDNDIHFRQVHLDDGGRIRYRKVCEVDEKEVPNDEIAKGFDTGQGTVLVEKDDLEHIPLPTNRQVDIEEFAEADQLDPIMFDKSYFLAPDRSSPSYRLLHDTMADSGKVAIAKVALRQKERLAALRVRGDLIVLHTMLWPDEVRVPALGEGEEPVKISDKEKQMATFLIESMTNDHLDMSEFHDEYRAGLEKLIEAKAAGRTLESPKAEVTDNVVDMTALLERSIAQRNGKGRAKKSTKKAAGNKVA